MNNHRRYFHSMLAVFIVSTIVLGAASAFAQESTINVDLNKDRLQSYSVEWWQWSLGLPAAVNPLAFKDKKPAADHCGVGQHGKVWFLGGTLDGTPANRNCTIPADTSLFFPILNAECSAIEGQGKNEAELRTCVKDLIDLVTVKTLAASVDGHALKDLPNTRVQSQLFNFTLPVGDILGLFGKSPNPSPAVSDGYWVLLAPLSPGAHSIKLHGEVKFGDGSKFTQDVTYNLTIVAPKFH